MLIFTSIFCIFILPSFQLVYPEFSFPVNKVAGVVKQEDHYVNSLAKATLYFSAGFEERCGLSSGQKEKPCMFKLNFNGKTLIFTPEKSKLDKLKASILLNTIGLREKSYEIVAELDNEKYSFGEIKLLKVPKLFNSVGKVTSVDTKLLARANPSDNYVDDDFFKARARDFLVMEQPLIVDGQEQVVDYVIVKGGGLFAGKYKVVFQSEVNGELLLFPFVFYLSVSTTGDCILHESLNPSGAYRLLKFSCEPSKDGIKFQLWFRRRICFRNGVEFEEPIKLVHKVSIFSSKFDMLYNYFEIKSEIGHKLKSCQSQESVEQNKPAVIAKEKVEKILALEKATMEDLVAIDKIEHTFAAITIHKARASFGLPPRSVQLKKQVEEINRLKKELDLNSTNNSTSNVYKAEWRDRMTTIEGFNPEDKKVYIIRRDSGYNKADGSMCFDCLHEQCHNYQRLKLLSYFGTMTCRVKAIFQNDFWLDGGNESNTHGILPFAKRRWPAKILRQIQYVLNDEKTLTPYFVLEDDYLRYKEDLAYYELYPLKYGNKQ